MTTQSKWMASFVLVLMVLVAVPKVQAQSVFVCDSKGAAVFHKNKACGQMKNCKSSVKSMSEAEAKNQKLRPCKSCFNANAGNTKSPAKGAETEKPNQPAKDRKADKPKGATQKEDPAAKKADVAKEKQAAGAKAKPDKKQVGTKKPNN